MWGFFDEVYRLGPQPKAGRRGSRTDFRCASRFRGAPRLCRWRLILAPSLLGAALGFCALVFTPRLSSLRAI